MDVYNQHGSDKGLLAILVSLKKFNVNILKEMVSLLYVM